jgi:hypothetical protein
MSWGLAFLADKLLPTRLLLLTTYYGINLCESGEISWISILFKNKKFLGIDVGFGKLHKNFLKKKKKRKRRKDTLDCAPKLGLLGSSFTETGDEMREVSKNQYTHRGKKQGTKIVL